MSGGEIIIILLIVLMFFGSKSIPKIARGLGKGMRQIKDATQEIQRDIQSSATDSSTGIGGIAKDLKKPLDDLAKPFDDLKDPLDKL